jgi:heptosyltransferase-2
MIRRCRLLVTNDTGPRHYATAFKVPAIVVMGPTDPAYTEYGLDRTTILRADVDCSPCHRHVCASDPRCMTSISPEMVFKEVEKILDASVIL